MNAVQALIKKALKSVIFDYKQIELFKFCEK